MGQRVAVAHRQAAMRSTIIVESDSLVSVKEGCITISRFDGQGTPVSCPPGDIGILLLEGLHSRMSVCALAALAEAKSAVLYCDARHMPIGMAVPLFANTRHERILQLQLAYRWRDRLWKEIVSAKIFNQSEHLKRAGCAWSSLRKLSRSVRNGDDGNLEATAAAMYFSELGIVRTTQRDEVNPMPNPALNYTYALVRAATARGLVAHGLLCAFGVHHDNMRNPYCLADDMMEPFRPIVDEAVLSVPEQTGKSWKRMKMDAALKKVLAKTLYRDVAMGDEVVPLSLAVDRCCASLAAVMAGERVELALPRFPR